MSNNTSSIVSKVWSFCNPLRDDRLQIKVEKGKGHKDRYVDVPMTLIEILREYYIIYKPTDRLFYGENKHEIKFIKDVSKCKTITLKPDQTIVFFGKKN